MKRIIDITLSLAFVLFALPFCIIIAIAIKLEDGNDVFYSSHRTGLNGKRFKMFKFRTMSLDKNLTDEQSIEFNRKFKLSCDGRVTKVGHWLRRFSIDEIPQFINVLKGDMSIIGPRPKLPEEIELYKNNTGELLSVLPGITGYWQVYRENANSDEIMKNMDLYYIRNKTISLDIKILLLTFPAVIIKKNY